MASVTHLVTKDECTEKWCTSDHLPCSREELIARIDRQWVMFQSDYWITNEGDKITLAAMDDRHVENTTLMLGRILQSTAVRFKFVLAIPHYFGNGDMAQLAAEEWHYDLSKKIMDKPEGVPIYAALLAEHERRIARRVRCSPMPATTEAF